MTRCLGMAASTGVILLLGAMPRSGTRASAASPLGRVVWHDLVTRDLDASKKFYGALFGWTWRAPTSGPSVHYIVGEMAGVAVAGLAESRQTRVNTAQWLSYFEVASVKTTVRDAVKTGGHVVIDPTRTAYQGESAVLLDPEGAPFAIMQAGGDTATAAAPVNGWIWNELWTRDKANAATFYCRLLGYRQRDIPFAGTTYSLFEWDSVPRAGMITIPVEDVRPNWLPTIRVADINAIVAKAVALGGRVIMAPRDDVRQGTVAIIADTQGAALAVQQWPVAARGEP